MPLTASCAGADPSPVSSSPPAGCGDFADPSHLLPSFAFVISQLSSLLLTTCSDSDGTYARQLLLFALSNVLFTSLHVTALAPPSPLTPAVQATPAPIVPTPVTESPSPSQPPLPSPPSRSRPPSPSPSLTIRVLTPVQPFTPPPRRSRRKRRRNRSRSCPPSPTLAASPKLPAPLADVAMEVKEVDSSNDGHRDLNLSLNARPSSEAVAPPVASEASEAQREVPPTTTTPTIAGSSSSSSSTAETKRRCSQGPPTPPSPAIVAPLATPNPFAPLVDDAKEDDAPHDVQRASNPISSACSASVAVAAADVSTTDVKAAAPASAVVAAVPEPVANKRLCTRACATTTPTPGFFDRLAARPAAVCAHFEKHFLPTSRMCSCDLFPVYASKVEGVSKLPPELNAFCLQCISVNVLSLGSPVVMAFSSWAPGFVSELEAYYAPFYEKKERKKLEKPVTEMEKEDRERRWMCLLERLGFADR